MSVDPAVRSLRVRGQDGCVEVLALALVAFVVLAYVVLEVILPKLAWH